MEYAIGTIFVRDGTFNKITDVKSYKELGKVYHYYTYVWCTKKGDEISARTMTSTLGKVNVVKEENIES